MPQITLPAPPPRSALPPHTRFNGAAGNYDVLRQYAGALCSVRRENGQMLIANAILHPNGTVYGDATARRSSRWRFDSSGLLFTDSVGRNRLTWRAAADGTAHAWRPRNAPPVAAGRLRPGMARIAARTPGASEEPTDLRLVAQCLPAGGRRRFECVVARFREDVGWADCIADYATVYRKAPEDTAPIRLPNAGREAGTYLHHIVSRYESLADQTLFLQGDPFPHHLLPFELYAQGGPDFTAATHNLLTREFNPTWSRPNQPLTRAAMADFLAFADCDPDPAAVPWTFGAQFCCSSALVRRRPLAYYQKLFDLSQRHEATFGGVRFDNHSIGFLFEFFWRPIFQAA